MGTTRAPTREPRPASKSKSSAGRSRPARKPKPRAPTVRRKSLRLDQKKLDLLRERLGLASDQEVVEHVIDEAVVDQELIDATVDLGGTFPQLVDVGRPR